MLDSWNKIFENKNKNPKFRNIYEVQFENRASLSLLFFFFWQGYIAMKMKIKE